MLLELKKIMKICKTTHLNKLLSTNIDKYFKFGLEAPNVGAIFLGAQFARLLRLLLWDLGKPKYATLIQMTCTCGLVGMSKRTLCLHSNLLWLFGFLYLRPMLLSFSTIVFNLAISSMFGRSLLRGRREC